VKILFIANSRVGDAVLSTGLLNHLASRHPDARFTIVASSLSAPLFDALARRERTIIIDKKPWSRHWLDLWRACVGERWSLVVDMRGSALAYLLWAQERRVLRTSKAQEHRVISIGRLLDLNPPPAPQVWTAARHREAAMRLIPPGPPVLGLGPTASWAYKTWPASSFATLARRLTEPGGLLPGARVVLFGGPGEEEAAKQAAITVPPDRVINLVGRLDLLTTQACLERCALYIGNDSGLMHMAAAGGVPTLGLFGPTSPVHYGPWGPRTAVAQAPVPYEVLRAQYRASGDVKTGSLLGSLTPEAVESAARALLRRANDAVAEGG
jgi:lipopolysaccharide export system permease protein